MKSKTYKGKIQYNPDTGRLSWCESGKEAGSVVVSNGRRYRRVTVNGVSYGAHQLAWMIITGGKPAVDAHVRFIDGDSLNIRADNLTYGHGRLSSHLKGVRYVIRSNSDIVYKYAVMSIRGDIVNWLNKFASEEEALAFIDELKRPPFKVKLTITNKKVHGVLNGETISYPVKNEREALAVALSVIIQLQSDL